MELGNQQPCQTFDTGQYQDCSSGGSNQQPNLCYVCQIVFSGNPKTLEFGARPEDILPQNVYDLRKSAFEGCCLCYLRWGQLSEEERASVIVGCEMIKYGFVTSRVGGVVVFDYIFPAEMREVRITNSIGLKAVKDIPAHPISSDLAVSGCSDSEKTFEIAQAWIENCSEKHEQCKGLIPKNHFLPTRLLDVGLQSPELLRLCGRGSFQPDIKYMTLSHCWGGQVPLTLTIENITAFQDSIDYFKLPKTFQDAVQITRGLQVRYLWIDSLCIIQNSDSDWIQEAATMADVYRHSWCNLAASKAKDGRDGCFSRRDTRSVTPCLVMANLQYATRQSLQCWNPNIWSSSIDMRTLSTRAWVLQEMLLAPRMLHYDEDQVFWECLELRACELFPNGIPNNTSQKISLDQYSIRNDVILKYQNPQFQRYRLWEKAVQDYSKRSLTFPDKDKLIAISGVAKSLVPEQEYLAGMWKSILPHQLMWSCPRDSTNTRSKSYRAPSWSWASIDGQVFPRIPWENDTWNRISIKIVAAEVRLQGSDPYGRVVGGHISLQGPLTKTTVRREKHKIRGEQSYLGNSLGTVVADVGLFADGSTVFCLPIQIRKTNSSATGIILEPTEQGSNKFYRCGYFSLINVEDGDSRVQDFLNLFETVQGGPLFDDRNVARPVQVKLSDIIII